MARPRKDPEKKALRTQISYRPDQAEKVRNLANKKKLSAICQDAIDAAET
jgi:hypothetical protein